MPDDLKEMISESHTVKIDPETFVKLFQEEMAKLQNQSKEVVNKQ